MLALVLSLAALRAVAGLDIKIHNATEFLGFSSRVRQGVLYRGVTVYLENDIDLSGIDFEPIGIDSTNYFPGTLDGQGHTISGLAVNTSSEYAGLFGYSSGLTVKNVVIDSTSFVESFDNSEETFVGGFVGRCSAITGKCRIENNVNMGSVSFHGKRNGDERTLYIGGLVGYILHRGSGADVKNCANYGPVTNFGISHDTSIGGLSGYTYVGFVYNCINYGAVTHNGISEWLFIGGIIGRSRDATVSNCVSMGSINPNAESEYIGTIVGGTTYTNFSNCYWSDSIPFEATGPSEVIKSEGIAAFNKDFVLNETITIGKYKGTYLLDALNAYTVYRSGYKYSSWALNKEEKTVSFTVNGESTLALNSQVILLPSLEDAGDAWFDGWYTDEECTVQLKNFEIGADMNLYGIFSADNNRTHTITFDTNGGSSIEPIAARYLEIVELPRGATKERYEFLYWETVDGEKVSWDFTMPSYDITLYAMFAPIHISSAEDLIAFSNLIINEIADYSGKTVYLDADIEFTDELSDKFRVIGGYEDDREFINGTFDGQGHVINGLKLNYTKEMHVGIFGSIEDADIKNVVIGDSCSITNQFHSNGNKWPCIGGIIGRSWSSTRAITIENIVNMMNIEIYADVHSIYLGGIVGNIGGKKGLTNHVKNCVNYGAITIKGDYLSYALINMGGIIGGWDDFVSTKGLYIQDCVNYGAVKLAQSTNECRLNIGGIIGEPGEAVFENCTNYGEVSGASTKSIFGIIAMMLVAFFLM